MDEELRALIADLVAQGMRDEDIVAELQRQGYDVAPAGAPRPARGDTLLGGGGATRPDATLARSSAPARPKYPPMAATNLGGAARVLADGLMLGWGGEAEALGRRVVRGTPYREGLERADSIAANYRESNPGAAFGLEIAGGLASGGMAGAGARAGLRAVGKEVGEAATRSAARKVGAGIAAGATGGAVAGAGFAPPGAKGAGAAAGAAVGAVLPPVAGVAGKAGKVIGRNLPMLQRLGADDEANARILRAILNDETVPTEVRQQAIALAAKGAKPETLIDLAGPNVKGLAEIIAQTPGKGSARIVRDLTERQRGTVGRLSDDIGRIADEALDTDGVPIPMTDLARDATDGFADLYKLAYRKGNILSKAELAPYMERPTARAAWQRATRSMKDKGMKVRPLFDADGKMVRTMNVKEFDMWKRALDDKLEDPKLIERGGLSRSDVVGITNDLKRPAVAYVDEVVPEYATARQKAGDFIRAERAGKRAEGSARGLKSFMQDDPGELAGDFREFADPEKLLYRTGAVRDMRGALNSQRSTEFGSMQDHAARIFGAPNQRAKLRTIAPDVADDVIDLGRRESAMTQTTNDILGGSPTARRIAQMADQNDVDILGVAGELASGGGAGLLRRGFTTLQRRAEGMTPRTQDLMAERLMRPNVGGDAAGTPLVKYLDDLENWRTRFNNRYYTGRGRVGGATGIFAGRAGEQP